MLADAGEFFEAHLWESEGSRDARDFLAKKGLKEKTMRAFGVGYAPIRPDLLLSHLHELGYSTEELVAAGLATLSVRGKPHAHLRSRVVFPIRDRKGRILGFAGLGTHLGPSWALWVTSPDGGLYSRSQAVFGLDRAAKRIAASKTAVVRPDCIEVLKAHQDGQGNAIAVHTGWVTKEQMLAIAEGVPGGTGALKLELPPGLEIEPERKSTESKVVPDRPPDYVDQAQSADSRPRHLNLKRLAIVTATALAAMNAWTGAPLLAVWVGSQVQTGKLLSMWGVVTVIAVLAVVELLLVWALTWLNAKYDELTDRPALAGQTSPWHRAKRGDRVEDIRSRYGTSAPEKVVAGSVVAAVLAFEVWFFFFAGSPLGSS